MTGASASRLSAAAALLLLLECCSGQQLQQYCRFTPQHTLCRTTGLGPECGLTVPVRGVNGEQAAVIVSQHNQLRARVALGQENRGAPGPQPAAADMMEMTYDEELSLTAQRLADQCVFEHDCADCRQVERFAVGQNLFISFQSDLDSSVNWTKAVQGWYDEVDLFNHGRVNSYSFEPSTGHYTALVWGSTRLLGCGFTMYEEGGWYKKLYVCNYGPTGNVIFTRLYQAGPACTACPPGSACSLGYPGLCESSSSSSGSSLSLQDLEQLKNKPAAKGQQKHKMNDVINTGSRPSVTQLLKILQAAGLSNLVTELEESKNSQQSVSPSLTIADTMIGRENTNTPTSHKKGSLQSVSPSPKSDRPMIVQESTSTLTSPTKGSQQPVSPYPKSPRQKIVLESTNTSTAPTKGSQQSPSLTIARPMIILESSNTPTSPTNLSSANNLHSFLSNFGKSFQVIRTNSLASVRAIINSLPQDSQPLVFFRSNMGSIRQLSNLKLSAQTLSSTHPVRRRPIRSTVSPAIQAPVGPTAGGEVAGMPHPV